MSEEQHVNKHANLVYDVGMHKGEDADYYLKKGFKVVGFEADPDLVAQCRNRFHIEIEKGTLIIVQGAIVDLPSTEPERKTVRFYQNRDASVWGTVAENWAHRNELLGTSNTTIDVPVIDFSKCLKEYGIPHYLKVDIEGMDTVCLRTLMHFTEKPDYVSIESEKVSFSKLRGELNLLTQLGYLKFKAVQQSGISRHSEPVQSTEGRFIGYHFQQGSSGLFGADLPFEWKGYKQILNEYKLIFLQYVLFGDDGKLNGYSVGRGLRKILSRLLRKPIPGWYDTHAKHSSVAS